MRDIKSGEPGEYQISEAVKESVESAKKRMKEIEERFDVIENEVRAILESSGGSLEGSYGVLRKEQRSAEKEYDKVIADATAQLIDVSQVTLEASENIKKWFVILSKSNPTNLALQALAKHVKDFDPSHWHRKTQKEIDEAIAPYPDAKLADTILDSDQNINSEMITFEYRIREVQDEYDLSPLIVHSADVAEKLKHIFLIIDAEGGFGEGGLDNKWKGIRHGEIGEGSKLRLQNFCTKFAKIILDIGKITPNVWQREWNKAVESDEELEKLEKDEVKKRQFTVSNIVISDKFSQAVRNLPGSKSLLE